MQILPLNFMWCYSTERSTHTSRLSSRNESGSLHREKYTYLTFVPFELIWGLGCQDEPRLKSWSKGKQDFAFDLWVSPTYSESPETLGYKGQASENCPQEETAKQRMFDWAKNLRRRANIFPCLQLLFMLNHKKTKISEDGLYLHWQRFRCLMIEKFGCWEWKKKYEDWAFCF